jgi:hypothetical protein
MDRTQDIPERLARWEAHRSARAIVEVAMVSNRGLSLEAETPAAPLNKQAGKRLSRKFWVTTFVVVGTLFLITLIFLIAR